MPTSVHLFYLTPEAVFTCLKLPPIFRNKTIRISLKYEEKILKQHAPMLKAEGNAEGAHEKAIATACDMLVDGLGVDFVVKYTKLSKEEVSALAEQVKASRQIKAMPGSVLAALQEGNEEESSDKGNDQKQQENREGREVLLEKYLQKIDPEHARNPNTTWEDLPFLS